MVHVALLIIALHDFDLPTGLRLRLCGDETFRQFDAHFRGGKTTLAAMRHLKRGDDGAFLLSRRVDETGMGKGRESRDRCQQSGTDSHVTNLHLCILSTAARSEHRQSCFQNGGRWDQRKIGGARALGR